jgi:uncharacterized membrane protein YbhN (UPF0104 family)
LLVIPTPVIFVISLSLAVVLLWRRGSLDDLGGIFSRADPGLLLLGAALYAFGLVGLCLRWALLIRLAGGGGDFTLAAQAFLTSIVVNYAAPIGLAVPTRAALSVRDLGLAPGAGGGVALAEIALDLAGLGLVSVVWLTQGNLAILDRAPFDAPALRLVAGGILVAAGVAALAVVAHSSLRRRVALAASVAGEAAKRQPRLVAAVIAVTIGFWALQAVILRVLLAATGVWGGTDWELIAGLLGPPMVVGMLSPVPGGAGVREALMIAVAGARGVDGAAVLLAAVVYRLALFAAVPVVYAVLQVVRLGIARRQATVGGRGGDLAIAPLPDHDVADRRVGR